MSAIAGIVLYESGMHSHLNTLGDKLMDTIPVKHADQVHTWQSETVYLGCSNQWITPESREERVPFIDSQRQLTITADAIIDNREEVFDRLGIQHADRSRIGDAQLILLAYAKWGEACPDQLIGDYAFMIWDEPRQQLFGARDLCGNRTLYYHAHDQGFTFCTVIQPLLQMPGMEKRLEQRWLAEYLAITGLHECSDPSLSPYRGILHLPPAHSIVVRRDGEIKLSRYGSIIPEEPLKLSSNEEYEEAFRDVVGRAVSARLRTFRPVAATLSGGLDSGTVVSFAARELQEQGKKIHTYSYIPIDGFSDWTPNRLVADERPYIQSVVDYVGNVEAHLLDFADKTPLSEADDVLDMLEAPYKYFGGTYWIKGIYEEAAKLGAGVLLTGGKGNFTISWGPAIDYYAGLMKQFHWIKLYRELVHYSQRMKVGRRKLLSVIRSHAFPAFARKSVESFEMPMMIHPEFAQQMGIHERRLDHQFDLLTNSSFEDRKYKFDNLAIANKSGILATKFSLRYGCWERDPTFDPRVVKFCLAVPIEQVVQDGMDRALLRRATKGYLPDDVRLNQRIRGVQAADWVQRLMPTWPQVLSELNRLCEDSLVSGILNVNMIRSSILEVGLEPKPEHAFHPKMQFLMRCLVVYRFLKKHL